MSFFSFGVEMDGQEYVMAFFHTPQVEMNIADWFIHVVVYNKDMIHSV